MVKTFATKGGCSHFYVMAHNLNISDFVFFIKIKNREILLLLIVVMCFHVTFVCASWCKNMYSCLNHSPSNIIYYLLTFKVTKYHLKFPHVFKFAQTFHQKTKNLLQLIDIITTIMYYHKIYAVFDSLQPDISKFRAARKSFFSPSFLIFTDQ